LNGEERRKQIYTILKNSDKPISGTDLAKIVGVSRQSVVQDIALMRANGAQIFSMNRGYFVQKASSKTRVFKTNHTDEETREELYIIVDAGGCVDDVFVSHRSYGIIRADLNIKSRHDVDLFMEDMTSGRSTPLKNITSGYHYHTVSADSPETLDLIKEKLNERGFLARLQDYEPVDFWSESI
jgi:transcriptional regulator of NAD metabolism